MKKRCNKGFTLVEILFAVGLVVLLGTIAFISFGNTLEKNREKADLAALDAAAALVYDAYLNDTGTSPYEYHKNGPFVVDSDNEKDLGTREVVRTKTSSGVICYKMWVWATQTRSGWVISDNTVEGITVPNTYNATGKVNGWRIQIKSDTKTMTIEKTSLSGKGYK